MAQPPAYARQYDFTGFSASYPSDQQPGVSLDAEFNAIRTSLNGAITNLGLIQRDDGNLKNALVTMDTLANDVLTFIGSGDSWTPRGDWATTTNYAVGDIVTDDSVSASGEKATYVCAVAHTSGTFSVDLTASKWIVLFDIAVISIADGEVTTAKIANGAVTSAKLDSSLSISGTFKATSGLAAGTAAAGVFPLAVKLDTGDVLGSIQRATQAQGSVGVRFEGGTSGKNWDLYQPAGSNSVKLRNVTDDLTPVEFKPDGQVSFGYAARFTGYVTPTGGAGLELGYSAVSLIDSYDRDATAWKGMYLRASTITLWANGTQVAVVSSTGVDFIEASINSNAIGYRDLPQVTKTASYTLALTDRGKHISITTGGIIIPANASVAFPVGSKVSIFNDSATAQTISITTDTLRHSGGSVTGSFSLQPYQFVELIKVASTVWLAVGDLSSSKLSANGFIRHSNGLYEMWGSFTAAANDSTTFNYTTIDAGISLSSFSCAVASGGYVDPGRQDNPPDVTACSTTGFTVYSSNDVAVTAFFHAFGR